MTGSSLAHYRMTGTHLNALKCLHVAGWRNWQTQTAQNRPTARSWGFKSLARYHLIFL